MVDAGSLAFLAMDELAAADADANVPRLSGDVEHDDIQRGRNIHPPPLFGLLGPLDARERYSVGFQDHPRQNLAIPVAFVHQTDEGRERQGHSAGLLEGV